MAHRQLRPGLDQVLYPGRNAEDCSSAWRVLPVPARTLSRQRKYGNACHNSLHKFPEPTKNIG